MLLRGVLRKRLVRASVETLVGGGCSIHTYIHAYIHTYIHKVLRSTTPFACTLLSLCLSPKGLGPKDTGVYRGVPIGTSTNTKEARMQGITRISETTSRRSLSCASTPAGHTCSSVLAQRYVFTVCAHRGGDFFWCVFSCMCVCVSCVCVCTCVCVRVRARVGRYAPEYERCLFSMFCASAHFAAQHIRPSACVHVCTCACMCVHLRLQLRLCRSEYVHLCACVLVCVCARVHVT